MTTVTMMFSVLLLLLGIGIGVLFYRSALNWLREERLRHDYEAYLYERQRMGYTDGLQLGPAASLLFILLIVIGLAVLASLSG